MKSTLYTAVAALLVFSSCSTAYKTAQTPDDVYYSPRTERTYASSDNDARQEGGYSVAGDEESGNYVTYDDEEGDYARRIDRFRNPYSGSYYSDGAPNVYVNNYYGFGYGSPYFGSSFGWPYYNSFWGPSLSIGLTWGWGMGRFYDPWYSPWYGGWGYNSWYYPHYAYWGGYGGWYGGKGYYVPAPNRGYRTRSSFGNTGSRGFSSSSGRVINGTSRPGDYRPRRIFNADNNSGASGARPSDYRPRRVFSSPSGSFNNGSSGSSGRTYQPRRIFQSSPSERPVTNPGRTFQRSEMRSPAPQRSFSQPSYSPPSSGGSSGGGGGRVARPRN